MRTTLVNGLALAAAVSLVSVACSKANGRPAGQATSHEATPPATGKISDALSMAADSGRIQGSPSAKVWVIEVSDFQCPFCKEWHDETYQMVLNDYVKTGKVRMAYVNMPLSMHVHAHEAAIAAMCASAQGKFWPMQDSLFASQHRWEDESNPAPAYDSLAVSVGVDTAAYHACLTAPSIAALVAGDQQRAQSGGVRATPSFWVDGQLLEGAIPKSNMKEAIDKALAGADTTAGRTPGK
jgi:protein-disulfide isomerase